MQPNGGSAEFIRSWTRNQNQTSIPFPTFKNFIGAARSNYIFKGWSHEGVPSDPCSTGRHEENCSYYTFRPIRILQDVVRINKCSPDHAVTDGQHITRDLPFITVYIDNIVIAWSFSEEQKLHLHQLFTCLREHGLRIHPDKCLFGVAQLDFLGYRITDDGIKDLPQNVDQITGFPVIWTVKNLR